MKWIEHAYALSLGAARPLLSAGRIAGGRWGRAVRGREQAVSRLTDWAAKHRDPARPLVWFHSPSVGEALMAQAIMASLRAMANPQVAFTFFSPSAERMAERAGADVHAYLPWDLPRDMRPVLEALRPAAIAFVRTEVWPTLARLAALRNARVLLVNAPLASGSSRLRPLGLAVLRSTYARLDAVGVVSGDDKDRFGRLGVPPDRIHVTGDARFDQVWQRTGEASPIEPLLGRLRGRAPIMVAGSTWPEDERRLLAAWPELKATGLRLIIAPHEPTPAHLARLEASVAGAGLSSVRLGPFENGGGEPDSVLLIDRVGLLADLYRVARVALVGGGFGRRGLHSVVEPAALGVPVVFGPGHGNAREASELAASGGGVVVTDSLSLRDAVSRLLANPDAGHAAREFVRARLGGAERNARLIARFVTAHAAGEAAARA